MMLIFERKLHYLSAEYLIFLWFVVKYEHNFFWETHPTGPEVLAQLFQMFWHTERESFWKLALDSHSFLFLLQYSVSVISFGDYYFCLKCLLNAIVLLDYCILLFSFRYNTFTPSFCVWFVFSRSFLSCCQVTFQKCCIVLIKALCAICIFFWCLSVGTSQRDARRSSTFGNDSFSCYKQSFCSSWSWETECCHLQ